MVTDDGHTIFISIIYRQSSYHITMSSMHYGNAKGAVIFYGNMGVGLQM